MSCSSWKADHPDILTFIFLPPREVPLGTGWSGRFLYTGVPVGEGPTCWLGTHRQRTTGWFLGSITPVGSGQGAFSFTGPFWKHAGRCLNRHAQGRGWKGNLSLSVSFSFSVFSVPPPFTSPLVLAPALPSPLSWNLLACVFKFRDWYLCLCCGFVCPTAPASLCWHCGHGGALKPWNTNAARIAWDSSLGLLSGILKNKKKRQELAFFLPLLLQYNYSAWAGGACISLLHLCNVTVLPGLSGTTWFICSPQTEEKKKKRGPF